VTPDEKLFAQALDLPPTARAAFLAAASEGDEALRTRVEALLAGYDAADDFLENSPIVRPLPTREENPGDVIDNYVLVRKIGEGGCGVVFLAEQTHPVKRQVALKIIKLGMDTLSVIARFEAERQALAMMDHGDIARVFDAGATTSGRPYFVMEFVDGQPITTFADGESLSLEARLELFARVCVALQHAHRKGIIHRDIKPSNILVSIVDGIPAPKIIDFGIAKATQGRLTDQTLVTGFDQFIGTPAYMSPEQAEKRDLDIDTRSDVYSLGVLLYELLTGRPPYDPKSLIRAGVAEIRRIIREVEPPRPSTAVSTLAGADQDTIARLRRAAPTRLTSALKGDLDWIIMRCLEKNRDRRYDSAQDLASDVRRHLRREPVQARPPELSYRVQRFVARNRLVCASATAVVLALVLGTIISTRQAIRATRAETVARAERDVANAATAAEVIARADAQRRQGQAEDLLTFMLGDFRTELKKIGRLNLLDAIGEKAMEYFTNLDPRDLTDTALARQAKAMTQIGEIRMNQARYDEAHRAFTTAYDRAAALAARHPDDPDMLFERAQAEYWVGFVARNRGDELTQHTWFTHYRDSAIALAALEGPTHRAQLELNYGHSNLAILDFERGHLATARQGFLASRASVLQLLGENPADTDLRYALADDNSWLGSVAELDGRYADALTLFAAMTATYRELVALAPEDPVWQVGLGESIGFQGRIYGLLGQIEAADRAYTEAQNLIKLGVTNDPQNQRWLVTQLSINLLQVALVHSHGNVTAGSQKLLDTTRVKNSELLTNEPSSRRFTRDLAAAWQLTARLRLDSDLTTAQAAVSQALTLAGSLLETSRADRNAIAELAQINVLAGRIASALDDSSTAHTHWQAALDLTLPELPASRDWRFLDPAAQAYSLLGDSAAARPIIDRLNQLNFHSLDPLAASLYDHAKLP
jgi:serine/threonine protein kinase/tetratricopeptide (TPR) repeat protein